MVTPLIKALFEAMKWIVSLHSLMSLWPVRVISRHCAHARRNLEASLFFIIIIIILKIHRRPND